jgi:hypothetical protein
MFYNWLYDTLRQRIVERRAARLADQAAEKVCSAKQ